MMNVVEKFLSDMNDNLNVYKKPDILYKEYKEWAKINEKFVLKKEIFFEQIGEILIKKYTSRFDNHIFEDNNFSLQDAINHIAGGMYCNGRILMKKNDRMAMNKILEYVDKGLKYEEGYINLVIDDLNKEYLKDKLIFEDSNLFIRYLNAYIRGRQKLNIEKNILSNVAREFNYITRNGKGNLMIHKDCPIKKEFDNYEYWVSNEDAKFDMYNHLFSSILKNAENPTLIKDFIKKLE